MKIKLVLVASVLALMSSCTDTKSEVSLSVETDLNEPQGIVVLYALQGNKMAPIDTLKMMDDGRYQSFKIDTIETFYRINVLNKQFANLILDGSEGEVLITFQGSSTTIAGSEQSLVVLEIDNLMAKLQRDIQQLNQEAGQANSNGDQATVLAIRQQYTTLQSRNRSSLKEIIRAANPSLAAVYGLNFIDMNADFGLFDSVATRTFEILPENPLVAETKSRVDEARTLSVGQMAPDFTMPDVDGVEISLSSLRGKYVMVDFWAAWCKPCRAENPNVVRLYERYGGDQFEILGVSLDRKKEAWVKAIADDGLEWLQVSDLNYYNNAAAVLYNINAIPATILIDPEGKIIAKNLRGPSLEAKLRELFD